MKTYEHKIRLVPEEHFGIVTENHSLLLNKWNMSLVTGLGLERDYTYKIKEVFVIKTPNYKKSIDSALSHGLDVALLDSFSILDNVHEHLKNGEYTSAVLSHIIKPMQYENATWFDHLKIRNINLTYRQVTRLLNHIAIWETCARTQKPAIVLENGAQLILKHDTHLPRNTVISLASGINKFHFHNGNYACMNNPSAYSIDQFVAKNLFDEVMKNGLIEPIETFFRVDKFTIIPENKVTL